MAGSFNASSANDMSAILLNGGIVLCTPKLTLTDWPSPGIEAAGLEESLLTRRRVLGRLEPGRKRIWRRAHPGARRRNRLRGRTLCRNRLAVNTSL